VADYGAVDGAVVSVLLADAALMAIAPDGVFIDISPSGSTRFVIVSRVPEADMGRMFGADAYAQLSYLVKVVDKNTSGTKAVQGAARIDAVLVGQPLPLTGYQHMQTELDDPVRFVETDDDEPDTRWQHAGGRYAVWVSPA
jgi:hypothetical protein